MQRVISTPQATGEPGASHSNHSSSGPGPAPRRAGAAEVLEGGRSVVRSGILLALGIGTTGVLNAVFSLVLTRLAGPAVYSAGGPLLSLGTAAAAASVGIEYAAAASIVRSRSFAPLSDQVKRLMPFCLIVFALTPAVSSLLHVSVLLSIMAMVLLVTTLAAAIPIAMLLARGLVWPLAVVAIAEAVVRVVIFVPFAHAAPLEAALGSSIGVTVLGGVAMAAYAVLSARFHARSAIQEEPVRSDQVAKSLLALGLYLPLVLPMWFARHLLLPERAGVLALAALLASGVAMLAGPVTSVVVPRVAAGIGRSEIRRGALLCGGIALFAAVCVFVLAPLVLPVLVASPMAGLSSVLGPLCLAGIGWAVAGYFAWVRVVQGERPHRFVAASVLGIGAQACLAFAVAGSLAVSAGPLLALGVFAVALLRRPVRTVGKAQAKAVRAPQAVGLAVPVSVGVMAYNEEGLIGTNLAAFLAQQSSLTRVTEVIVVVSGSTDGTELVVKRFAAQDPRIRLIIESERRGKVFAVERFLSEACNEICVVASADVTPAPDCLDHLVRPMFNDAEIGMTGPRVAPTPRRGFIASMHRVLWAAHNRIGAASPKAKLGEVVAVRRSLVQLNPVAGCDEVLLEASVVAHGARLAYADAAVVHNMGPSSFSDYVAHRRRIHVMHLVTRRDLGYCPATLPMHNGIGALIAEVIDRPTIFATAVGCMVAEVSGRALGRWDVHRGKIAMTWQPSLSARPPSDRGAVGASIPLTSRAGMEGPSALAHPDTRPRFWQTLRGPALASLVIQLAVAPFTSLPGDVAVWWQTAERAMAGIGLYGKTGFSYPPLYGYWCMFLGGAAHLIGLHASALGGTDPSVHLTTPFAGPFVVTTPVFTLLLKLPMIAADCIAGYYVWRIALRLGGDDRTAKRRARFAFYWWAFNPLVIVESAVHGQIDAIAACAIVAAVFYALEDRWMLAGVAVALGVAVKISPVFLIPPLLGFAIGRGCKRWRYVSAFVIGGVATGAVVIGPLLGGGLIENVFTRVGVGASAGGLGLTGLTSLSGLQTIGSWLVTHDAGVVQAATAATVIVSIIVGVWCGKGRDGISLAKACLVVMAASLVLSPVVNPQYLLWITPLLALGAGGVYGGRSGWYKGTTALLGIAAIAYLVALFGWAELLAPSSAAFGWPSAHTIMAFWSVLARKGGARWLPASLGAKLALAATCLVLVGAALATAGLLGSRASRSLSQDIARSRPAGRIRWTPFAIAGMVVVAIEVAALVTPAAVSRPAISAALSRRSSSDAMIVVNDAGTHGVRLAAYPVSSRPVVRRVLVYWSPTHPDSGAVNATVLGTTQTLQNLVKKTPITVVGAHRLAQALRRTRLAAGSLLLDAAGTLPKTVWGSVNSDLLTRWIKAGGILAFAGNIPGYYAVSSGPLLVTRHGKVGLAPSVEVLGSSQLLPSGVIDGLDTWTQPPYEQSSVWARALGLEYSQGEIPISIKGVLADNGSSLGLVDGRGQTSEAFVPLGVGGILAFAGVDLPGTIAHDVARLIQSDWFAQVGTPAIAGSASGRSVLNVAVPRTAIAVEVVAFSADSQADWIWTKRLIWHGH